MRDRPNVLVVVLDTARADHLPPHEPGNRLAPGLARLAEGGRALEIFRTTAPWTLPSHASLFCGAYPSEHGIHGRAGVRPDRRVASVRSAVQRQGELWLPESLRRAGYRTWAVSANPWISEPMGLSFGFERFVPVGAARLRPRGTGKGTRERASDGIPSAVRRPLGRATRHLLEWRRGIDAGGESGVEQARGLMRDSGGPWFGFVNLMEAHVPYAPPRAHNELGGLAGLRAPAAARKRRSYRNALSFNLGRDVFSPEELATIQALYRGEIRYLDALVGRLLADLPANTVLIVTADHGEALGEHHQVDHQMTVIEEVLRIPFLLLGGAEVPEGFASIRQLPELLAGVAGLDPSPWRARQRVPPGVAVAQYESTVAHDRRSVGVAREGGFPPEKVALLESEMAAVVEGERKLVEVAGLRSLHSLPGEAVVHEPGTIDRLAAHLESARSVRAPEPDEDALSDEDAAGIEERLEQLGYL